MAQVIADRRDIDFVLYEQLKTDGMTRLDKFKDFNKKTFDMIITEARNFAIKELLPTNAEGDKEGLGFENGQVKVPQCFHRAYELFVDGEWTSLTEDPEWGGQGLPNTISQAVAEYLIGSNWAVANYVGMGHGTGKMIEIFGTQAQKELFLKNLLRKPMPIWGFWIRVRLILFPKYVMKSLTESSMINFLWLYGKQVPELSRT